VVVVVVVREVASWKKENETTNKLLGMAQFLTTPLPLCTVHVGLYYTCAASVCTTIRLHNILLQYLLHVAICRVCNGRYQQQRWK
jgi:hypothetical protein